MVTGRSFGRRGQVLTVGVLLIGVLLLLATVGALPLLSRRRGISPVLGQPKKDPNTGLYNVYVVVNGHRDFTVLQLICQRIC